LYQISTTKKIRKISPKEILTRKRRINLSEWIDVGAKKKLNYGEEHSNRVCPTPKLST